MESATLRFRSSLQGPPYDTQASGEVKRGLEAPRRHPADSVEGCPRQRPEEKKIEGALREAAMGSEHTGLLALPR